MSLKQLGQEISKGFPAPVYLFYSPEPFLLYDTSTSIKEVFGGDAFNFDIFDAKSADDSKPMEQIIDVLNTLPFLAGRRVTIIENAQKLSKKDMKGLTAYLDNPSPAALLVLLYEGPSQKLLDASALKNVKAIALNIYEKDIPLWIKDAARKKGIELTPEAVQYMIAFVGTDLGMLSAELEKFSFGEAGRVIGVQEIRELVYAGAEYSAFDLTASIKEGNMTRMFRIFDNLSKDSDPQMLLGALNWQYSNLLRNAGGKADKYLNKVFRLLHEADIGIKTSRSYVLENLLVKLIRLRPSG